MIFYYCLEYEFKARITQKENSFFSSSSLPIHQVVIGNISTRMRRHHLLLVMSPFTIPFRFYVCKWIRCPCRPTKQADLSTSKKKKETLLESNSSNIILDDIVTDGVGWKREKETRRKNRGAAK